MAVAMASRNHKVHARNRTFRKVDFHFPPCSSVQWVDVIG